jgi:hypothetical protein
MLNETAIVQKRVGSAIAPKPLSQLSQAGAKYLFPERGNP